MKHEHFAAIVLAGSRPEGDPLAIAQNVPVKAMLDIAGQPMISHVLRALKECPLVDEIVICGDKEYLNGIDGAEFIKPDKTPSISVQRAMMSLPQDKPVLITTADHPLLSAATLSRFLDDSIKMPCDATVGVVEAELVKDALPQTKRTTLKFAGEKLHGSNLFTLMGPQAKALPVFWQRLENFRKKPLRMAKELGFINSALYLCGLLTIGKAFRDIGRLTSTVIRPVVIEDPHAAVDVDKESDLELVREIFKKQRLN